jgi:hypothetical protein
MILEGAIKYDAEKARTYLDFLIKNERRFELTEKKKGASRTQKRYAELIFSGYAMAIGETREYVKQVIFKQEINPDIFRTEHTNGAGITRVAWRSIESVDSRELTLALERFRNHASMEGHYLPAPNEERELDFLEQEASKYINQLYT